MTSAPPTSPAPPADGVEFSSLPWNMNLAEQSFYIHLTTTTSEWTDAEHLDNMEACVYSYKDRPLPVHPATTSLNYGTTIWEGIRAHRIADDKAVVFRPDRNYERMKKGAHDMCLPMPSRKIFMKALQLAVQKNVHYLPPPGDGVKLYLRPMLVGTGQQLGLYPSPEMSFLVYVSPTGNYFSAATTGLNIHLETNRSRASRGGTGSTKCAGNYGIALRPLLDAKKQGFNDNLFLELETYAKDQLESAVIQEMSAANVFFIMKSGEIVTPSLDRGTILPGVTRDSVLNIIDKFASELTPAMVESTGNAAAVVKAVSRDLTVGEIKDATECFCTGTAAEICPIRRIATGEGEEAFVKEMAYGATLPGGPVTSTLLTMLRQVMKGERTVQADWLRDPYKSLDEFGA